MRFSIPRFSDQPSRKNSTSARLQGRSSGRRRRFRLGSGSLLAVLMLGGMTQCLQSASQSSSVSEHTASITGTVSDTNGTPVPGATITVVDQSGTKRQPIAADDQGRFVVPDLPAGVFRVTITSPNFKPFTSDAIALAEGEKRDLSPIVLHLTSTSTDVEVVATQLEIAQAQVAVQEKQRVLGIVPNFYTSYVWKAAPLTPKLKFGLAVRSTIDPVEFAVAGGVAGVEQWHNTFPGYGRGTEGYLKRYGAAYADNVAGAMISRAILPSLLHQDPRYFYMGSGSTSSRAWYALKQTVICRGDDGRPEPDYSRLIGSFAAAGVSNLYRAPEDRSASLTFRNGFIIIGSSAIGNLVREFLLRKLTPNVPSYAQGKP
jgi:hypothetical protein